MDYLLYCDGQSWSIKSPILDIHSAILSFILLFRSGGIGVQCITNKLLIIIAIFIIALMFNWFENLPVELVGINIFGMLGIRDIVMLERACGSKASHQHFMNVIPYCSSLKLPEQILTHYLLLQWFAKRNTEW